jgi:RNA polymerase sigma-70 factor (ECF subfamily)
MTTPADKFSNKPSSNDRVIIPDEAKYAGKRLNKVLDEDALILSLRNKERKAYELLYDSYASTLLGVISRIIKDSDSADDILSESFIKIVSSFEQYDRSRGRLFTWMINITRNLCFDKLKSKEFRNQTKNMKIDDAAEFLTSHSTSFDPSHTDLKSLTAKLDPKERHLVDLAYFQGYTHKEIAKEFNMPLGTVKTRLRKAIIDLRLIFGHAECGHGNSAA